MTKNEDDFLSGLIAAGILLVVGHGLYRLLKAFGTKTAGQIATAYELVSEATPEATIGTRPPQSFDQAHIHFEIETCPYCGGSKGGCCCGMTW